MTTVRCSELIGARRIDAEAYQRKTLNAYDVIAHLPHVRLGDVAFITDGQHGYHVIDETSDIKHLTAQCIRNGYVDASNTDRISAAMHARNQRSACEAGDVVLSTAGTIGNAGVVTADILPANMDQDLARIKIHDQRQLNPWYVATFFNSRFGRLQTGRESTGQVQQHLALEKVRQLRIPLLEGRGVIAQKAQRSFELFRESEALYAQAQSLLSAELGLERLDLPTGGIAMRRLSEIAAASRIDAEYFHPQKAHVQAWLAELPGKTVADYFNSRREIYNPPREDTEQSILNFDLTDALRYFVDETGPVMPENEIGSMKKRIKRGDVIVSRLRSYLKEIAIVEVPQGIEAVCSSEFIVLRSRSTAVYPEVLIVYLRSEPVQTILKWSQDGSNHPRFQENELLAIKLPDKVIEIQDDIRRLIRSGIQASREAKRLLAEARTAVERMIGGAGLVGAA